MQQQVLPTASQVEWANCEVGVIIHFDVQVFEPNYRFRNQWGYTPPPAVFAPRELDTDQWLDAAASAGAKYAVLVAKHCSGFSLWPTAAHDYSVANAPWRDGKGDIVGDFFASCERRGIRPGLYCSTSCNACMNVDNPGTVRSGDPAEQQAYNNVVIRQLTELWTHYGDVFEIWFDGGTLAPEKGGPDIASLLHKLQPEAVVFQGPPECTSLLRWVGNERAEAPYPCWSRTNILTASGGEEERHIFGVGDPDGQYWAPAESDMPNRDQRKAFMGGWFWREGDDEHLYSVEHLLERYYLSVGRNSNLLLGMVIDNRGLVPDADTERFAQFGTAVRTRFARCVAETNGTGTVLTLPFAEPATIDHIVIMEAIAAGQRIRRYHIDGITPAGPRRLAEGSSIGHKRIERIAPVNVSSLTLHVDESSGEPVVGALKAYAPK